MKPTCIKVVEAAIGRPLGAGESERIEGRMVENMRELARTDEKWAAMSQSERLIAAAKRSLEVDTARAAKAAQRKALNIAAQAREAENLTSRAGELGGKNAHHKALFERLRQLDNYITGVRSELFGSVIDALKAAEPRFLQLLENAKSVEAFVREVYGEKTGNAIAEKGAKAYLETLENIRTRENAAGADIGKLDYSYLPQPHDTGAIVKAGKDAWVTKVFPKMARERFVKEDGAQMNDAELTQFLEHVYDTLATEGLIRRAPGAGGRGSRASRFDEAHRVLHFKDAESYLSYFDEFGKGSVFESIHNHIGSHAKNIGMMEAFGANPASTYHLLKDVAQIEDSRAAGKPVTGVTKFLATPDMVWETINGDTATPVNPRAAAIGRGIRNYLSATRLGGIMLSSINDAPTWLATARYNGVPLGNALKQFFASVGSGSIVDDAARLGLAVDSIAGEMQTWHAGNMRQDWTGKLANTTMKLQLVESWTHRLRAGLGIMLQDRLATLKEKGWSELSSFDRDRMKAAGISEKDWQIWQAATPETIRGRQLLTANAIRDVEGFTDAEVNHATAAMLGFIDNEAKTAVLAPDAITRAAITQGAKAGTFGGELGRSVMLFKSFPLAMMLRNIDRLASIPTAQGKIAYSMALMTTLTLFGALSLELKDLVAGRNPRDATTGKFWGAAFAQGGGLGIFGDVLYTGIGGNSRAGNPNWTNLGGPVLGGLADLGNVTLGNIGEKLQGKDAKAAAELLRFTRSNLPFLNLWYLKAAVDHMGLNDLQENVSPGYLARQRAAARRDWGTTYWWEPNELQPSNFPEMARAVGE
jgi:uncharacterized protein YdcH (DUF465 family)